MQFHYLAADKNGKIIEENLDASSMEEALTIIFNKGLKPINIKPIKEIIKLKGGLFKSSMSVQDKIFLMRYLSLMLKVGTDLFKAIEFLSEDFEKPATRLFLLEVKSNLEKGNPFYTSFQNHPELFSEVDTNLIKAGEESGNLEKILDQISISYSKQADLQNKIRSALIYPVLLLVVAFVIIILLITFVIPRLSSVFSDSGVEIPAFTSILISIGNFFSKYFFIIFPLLLVIIGGLIYFFTKVPKGKILFSKFTKKLPVIKDLIQKTTLQRFSFTLSSLLKSGLSFVESLKITASAVGDEELKEILIRIADEKISSGVSIIEAFKSEQFFPQVVINLMGIGERAGRMEEVLNTLAEFYEQEIDNSLNTVMAVVEPALLVFIGLIVAGIAMAVIMPLYSMISQVAI